MKCFISNPRKWKCNAWSIGAMDSYSRVPEAEVIWVLLCIDAIQWNNHEPLRGCCCDLGGPGGQSLHAFNPPHSAEDCSSWAPCWSAFWACPPSSTPGLKLWVPLGWGASLNKSGSVVTDREGWGAGQTPCDKRSIERRVMGTHCCILFNRAELTSTGSWGFISSPPACCAALHNQVIAGAKLIPS